MIKRIIEFHVGPRKCGKSISVETKILKFNKLLYIATLPTVEEFNNTIRSHKERRGEKWNLIELC